MNEYTFEDIYQRIRQEGEGYYVLHYTDGSELPDEKSKELFKNAQTALWTFLDYIDKKRKEEK